MATGTPQFKAPTIQVPAEDASPALSRLLDTFSPRARKLSKIGLAEVCLVLLFSRRSSQPYQSGLWRCCHAVPPASFVLYPSVLSFCK